ncbi:MAG: FAD-dependent oxidoreductase [Pseudomonas sp.]
MTTSKQVVVIGAGVIGCAIALQLSRKGYRTINVDRNAEVGFGSTSNSCAVVRFSYSLPETVMLAYEGFHYWKHWEQYVGGTDERGLARYTQCGHLMLRTDASDRTQVLEFYREFGIPFAEWDVAAIRHRLPLYDTRALGPAVSVDDPAFFDEPAGDRQIHGGVFTPEAGYVGDPQLATHNLRRATEALGGSFVLGKRVTAVLRAGDAVAGVELEDGTKIDADIVVNAAGPHSFVINKLAGVDGGMSIGTRALRREVHHLPSPPDFDFGHYGVMTSDGDLQQYFRPETGNKVTVGSGDPACDPLTWVDDPDDFNSEFTEQQWKTQVYRAARRIPGLPIPSKAQGVVSLYDVSDDWVPLYDKSDLRGFYMAVGTSGHQFKNAGVVGDLMSELIDACEQGLDHDESPLTFTCRHTGYRIDTGVFSRRRAINRESSFSVRG